LHEQTCHAFAKVSGIQFLQVTAADGMSSPTAAEPRIQTEDQPCINLTPGLGIV
jgi:hypothetical protein